jgi:phosphatidylserine/phosphatidylglycerophosphate/cardiolipin synthase-like enzyme
MDKTRLDFIKHLQTADRHKRFRAYSPVTTLGRTIIVHAKLTIIDDELLRIGSANINNRSLGFDTECDLSIEASGRAPARARARIAALRTNLLAHWLGCEEAVVAEAQKRTGSVLAALEDLRTHGYARLRPIEVEPMSWFSALVASYHLGDPVGRWDAWRPWLRRRALQRDLGSAGLNPKQAKLVPEH